MPRTPVQMSVRGVHPEVFLIVSEITLEQATTAFPSLSQGSWRSGWHSSHKVVAGSVRLESGWQFMWSSSVPQRRFWNNVTYSTAASFHILSHPSFHQSSRSTILHITYLLHTASLNTDIRKEAVSATNVTGNGLISTKTPAQWISETYRCTKLN
jgi:hypothetical protein